MRRTWLIAIAAFLAGSALAQDKPKKPEWKKFVSREGAFAVLMPGTPVAKKEAAQTPLGPLVAHLFSLEVEIGSNFTVSFSDVPQGLLGLEGVDDLLLTQARDAAVAKLEGKLLKDERGSLNKRFPGREFHIEVPNAGIVRMRIYLVQNRVFQIVAAGPKEFATGKDADRFFNSFTLTR